MILLECQNRKTILQKAMYEIGLKKFLWLKKCETLYCGLMFISDLKSEEIVGTFYEKQL